MNVSPRPRADALRATDPAWLGRYRLLGRLGQGGMGIVYLAETPQGTFVAIKVIRLDVGADDEFRRRFRSEVNRAREVPPFCTAEVLDADPDHEYPYLVVEYVDGPSLAEVVEQSGPLRSSNLQGVAIGVATALSAIHGAGVIHRDLKPSNVLLAPGNPKVIDFGIAQALETTSHHTRTDQMVGTIAYMSPERFDTEVHSAVTQAADIFAWGAVVTYAGTGRTPFQADSHTATAARILTQPPNLAGLDGPLRDLVAASLSKDPAARPAARDLLDSMLETGGAGVARAQRFRAPSAAPFGRVPPAQQGADPPAYPTVQMAPVWNNQAADTSGVRRPRRTLLALLAVATLVAGIALALPGTVRFVMQYQTGSPSEQITESYPAAPSRTAAPASTVRGLTAIPADVEAAIEDDLLGDGYWEQQRTDDGSCLYDVDGMHVAAVNAIAVHCGDTEYDFARRHQLTVAAKLTDAGSCASVWFLVDRGSGYRLTACATRWLAQWVKGTAATPIRTFPLNAAIPLGKEFRIGLEVRGTEAVFVRDTAVVGAIQLKERTAVEGGFLRLGVEGDAAGEPPYRVTFRNLAARSLE